MAGAARIFTDYRDALVMSYEEEISGEAYFGRLAEFFTGRQRQALLLLAEMERCTAAAIRPLIDRYGLAAADPAELRASGEAEADTQSNRTWPALIAGMASDLPAFVEEFEQIERLAPASDRTAIDTLTKHEIAAVDFAKREAGGDPDSLRSLYTFLADIQA